MCRSLRIITLCFILLFCYSCKPGQSNKDQQINSELIDKEQLLELNRLLIRQDAVAIRNIAEQKGWDLTETETGLFYQVLEHSDKRFIPFGRVNSGDKVTLSYSIHLIDGTFCYSSRQDGHKVFIVDKTEIEQGLNQAVKLFEPGDSARIVIPPYLAFGLVGDGNKIPARSILVYEVRLQSVERESDR
jgi:FKBP-type peptidyl-prolyl cis-trans isomerase